MKVILAESFFNSFIIASVPEAGIDFVFYSSGDLLFCENSIINDVIRSDDQSFNPVKIQGIVKFIPPGDYEIAGFEFPHDSIMRWILPDLHIPLFENINNNPSSIQEIIKILSDDSKIVINGIIHESPGVMYEHKGRRYASSVSTVESSWIDSRTLLWLGKGNFEKINSTAICCIGAGGVMNPFLVQAVHHGFRKFIIIDEDRLESHNLNRFVGALPGDEGKYKTEIIMEYIKKLRPDSEVTVINRMFPEGESLNAMAGADLVVAGVDNNYTRILIQLYALALNRAFFDMGSGIFLEDDNRDSPVVDERGGQVRFLSPGGPCLACMGVDPSTVQNRGRIALEERRGYIAGTDITPPSVVTLNFAVSSICLNMTVEYITTGLLNDNHIHYDEKEKRILKINETSKAGCPLCAGIPAPGSEPV